MCFFTCPNVIHYRENSLSGSVNSWQTQTELDRHRSRNKWVSRETCDFFPGLEVKNRDCPGKSGTDGHFNLREGYK